MAKSEDKVRPPNAAQYRDAKISLALDFAPTIRACKTCKWPHVSGYVCTVCGETDP